MKLEQDRLAYIYCGSLHLSTSPDTRVDVLKHVLHKVYGTLSGIKIVKILTGAELNYDGNHYQLPPRSHYVEVS